MTYLYKFMTNSRVYEVITEQFTHFYVKNKVKDVPQAQHESWGEAKFLSCSQKYKTTKKIGLYWKLSL
jgi:hypothetical protein